MLDWYMVSKFQVVNWEDKMYTCIHCGNVFGLKDYQSIVPSIDFEEGLKPSQILQKLDLHQEEIAVLRAFIFFETSKYNNYDVMNSKNKTK